MSIFSQPGFAPGLWFCGLCGLCMSNNYKTWSDDRGGFVHYMA